MSNPDQNFKRMSEILNAQADEAVAFGLSPEVVEAPASYEEDIDKALKIGNDNGKRPVAHIEVQQVATSADVEAVEVKNRPSGKALFVGGLALVTAIVGGGAVKGQQHFLDGIKNQTSHTVINDGPTRGINGNGEPVIINK